MKINILLLLSLFAGSIHAHPQGLMDRLYKRVLPVYANHATLVKTFRPSEEDVINLVVPDNNLAKVKIGHKHYHVTAKDVAKETTKLIVLGLNIRDALAENDKFRNAMHEMKHVVVRKVILDTVLDRIKDKLVDTAQDAIVDNLPESVTEKNVHPIVKWFAARATGVALGFVYDQTAGRMIHAGLNYVGRKK